MNDLLDDRCGGASRWMGIDRAGDEGEQAASEPVLLIFGSWSSSMPTMSFILVNGERLDDEMYLHDEL